MSEKNIVKNFKILFLCGSLEPGQDGVGDYTRRLSGALIRMGHQVTILSLCDNHSSHFITQIQETEQTPVVVQRIPQTTSYQQRFSWMQQIVTQKHPDWISLQFVPYSFNPKGLPFWLPSCLKDLAGNHKWHIMFHELWLGIDKESSLKEKCIGKIQQILIKKIIDNMQPCSINTQNNLYQFFLQSHHIKSTFVPICSNIPVTVVKERASAIIQFVLFGTIHNGAPFENFVNDLMRILKTVNMPIKFVFIGKNGPELYSYKLILEKYTISYEVMDQQAENIISQVLSDSDFGISTTPYVLNQKSGSLAAMFEHNLTVLCVARNWSVKDYNQRAILNLTNYENKKTINDFMNKKFMVSNENKLESVALKFLKCLK